MSPVLSGEHRQMRPGHDLSMDTTAILEACTARTSCSLLEKGKRNQEGREEEK